MRKLILTCKIVELLQNPGKMAKNGFPRPKDMKIFANRFFYVLGVAKRRRRLEF